MANHVKRRSTISLDMMLSYSRRKRLEQFPKFLKERSSLFRRSQRIDQGWEQYLNWYCGEEWADPEIKQAWEYHSSNCGKEKPYENCLTREQLASANKYFVRSSSLPSTPEQVEKN